MKRHLTLLALLFLPALARADVGPSIHVRWLGPWPEPAVSGRPLDGLIELRTGVDGTVENVVIGGNGWTLVEADLPGSVRIPPDRPRVVRFRAIPADPAAPLQVRGLVNGVPFLQEFRLDAERLARIGKPGVVRAERAPILSGFPKGSRTQGGGRNIRFHGRFLYVRQDGRSTGADNVVVRVMDDDSPFSDEEIGRFLTDSDGNFDQTLFWDDCDITGCDEPDVYLVYEVANLVADVRHLDSDELYTWSTEDATVADFGGTDLDFGLQFPGSDDAAVHMYTSVIRAQRFAQTHGGMAPPLVHIYYPDPGQGAFYTQGLPEIHVGNPEAWIEGTHIHEYGHHLEKNFSVLTTPNYNNGFCDTPNPGHCVWCPENATDAWQEGWPNWFGSRLLRTWNQTYGYAPLSFNDSRYTLETLATCPQDNQSYASASTEGYVGAILRDIDDSQQDDEDGGTPDCIMDALALGDDEIFTVFRDDDPASLIAFILSFRARYPEHDQDLWSTIENDLPAVNFTIPTPTVTTQPQPCLHMKNGDVATLTVQGNGSLLHYQWRHDGTPIADGFSYLGVTTNALKVQMVNPTVAGLYDCVISTCDNSKSVTSAATRIQYDLPTFARPLVSWGENYEGQVADGTTSPSRSAYPWAHLDGVVEADGGRSFGMALGPDGVVRTWGTGGAGELGNGAFQQFTPVAIAVNDAIDIAAGNSAGYAVRRNGTLVAWGYNSNGELGTGDQLNRSVPSPTQFPNCVRKVVAGHNHAVALLGDGTVWATGYNGSFGIQGTGTFGGWTTVPHPVPGLANVVDVAAGSYHTLALLADGTVWSWGYNAFGQLGNGSTNPSASPVQVTGLTNIRSIAGDSYNSFAVRTDGQAYGWGDSYRVGSGLGSGVTLTPVLIPALSNVEKIDCGDSFAMALVGDKLKVWGDNLLGSPTTVGVFNTMGPPSNVPVDVPYVWGLTGFGTGFATVFAYGSVAVTDVPGESDGPIALALRAQPNPARGATTFYYAVPTKGNASLRVYDAAGRLVRTLLDEPRPAGRYTLTWDGTSDHGTRSAAGVYFVRLATPAGTMNRTVLRLD